MNAADYAKHRDLALEYFEKASIILTDEEKNNVEVADFGLNDLDNVGLQLVVYVNTERVCAKEMVLLPRQSCPEHWHVDSYGMQGKEETFRCRYGKVYLYVEGEGPDKIEGKLPEGMEEYFTCRKEIILNPGEQYTIMPNTLHWFQGGAQGAVVSEFSTHSTDETDVFTDTDIVRMPTIEND